MLIGCSAAPVPVAEVSGTIQWKTGEPVQSAAIRFVPVEASLPAATGQTDEKGNYTLTYQDGTNRPGAVPGKYKVTLMSGASRVPMANSKGMKSIPARYAEAAKTPLEVEVTATNGQTIPLVVEAKR